MNGDLNRDEHDDDEGCQFLFLSKRPKIPIPDNEGETQESECKQVVWKTKKRSTLSTFLMRDISVCKFEIKSDKVVLMLVKIWKMLIEHNHCPSRWLKFADAMLEQVKVPRLKKLRILEMIEINLQLMMGTHLGVRMNNRVKTDQVVTNYNYSSRKGNYIENSLLEKILIFYHANKTEELNVHAMSDLESFHDR